MPTAPVTQGGLVPYRPSGANVSLSVGADGTGREIKAARPIEATARVRLLSGERAGVEVEIELNQGFSDALDESGELLVVRARPKAQFTGHSSSAFVAQMIGQTLDQTGGEGAIDFVSIAAYRDAVDRGTTFLGFHAPLDLVA